MEPSIRQSPTIGNLAAKLAKILGEIGKVEKTGHNSFHKYDYVTENDLVYAVRGRLSEAGIFVFESTVSQHVEVIVTGTDDTGAEKKALLTTVVTEHTFADGESGEWFTVRSQGQGSDNGDKGGYKAITGAMKYFVYKNFMIPTGDDPEGDDRTDQRGAGGVTGKTATSTLTPRQPARESQGSTDDGGGTSAQRRAAEVPRDPEATEDLRDQFRGNKWTVVKIHFGKNKGTPLAKLEDKSLQWYIENFQPKGWKDDKGVQHPPSADDCLLRAALDVADEEWQ